MDIIQSFLIINEDKLNELWNNSYICFYIFNLLNDIEKNITLRLLYGKHHVYQLFNKNEQNPLDKHCKYLINLHLIKVEDEINVTLNETFKKNLSIYFNENESIDQYSNITEDEVHNGMIKWERLLIPLIDIYNNNKVLFQKYQMNKEHYESILNHYKEYGYINNYNVTSLGYDFMMSNPKNQVWMIINDLIEDRQNKSIDLNKIRIFIYLCVKLAYGDINLSQFKDQELHILNEWDLIGIIHLQDGYIKSNSLVNLFFGFHKDSDTLIYLNNCIIMESNYMLYTYNTSEVHLHLLRLFSKIICKLHNMSIAKITRKSIQRSLSKGMNTNMIMRFIKSNQHILYTQQKKNQMIDNEFYHFNPKNYDINEIYDQIGRQLILWENEYNCFQYYQGFLIRNFEKKENYEYTKQKFDKAILWFNDEKQMLFIKKDVNEDIKRELGL